MSSGPLEDEVEILKARVQKLEERNAELYMKSVMRSHQLEDARQQILTGIHAYRSRLDATLSEYRGQRAWQVMLLLRKLYSHAQREGLRGWMRIAEFLVKAPFRGIPVLSDYDLSFPDIRDDAPAVLYEPYFQQASPPGARTTDHYDVIILPVLKFEYRFQRPQRLAVQFAAHGHRVFWVSHGRTLLRDSNVSYQATPIASNLWEVNLNAAIPDVYMGRLDTDQVQSITHGLLELCRDWKIDESCTIVQLPFWRKIGLELRGRIGSVLVYDCVDEWETFPRLGDFTRREERPLAREADVVSVTGSLLEERFKGQGIDPVVIRNAVDLGFNSDAKSDGILPRDIPKPVIGYTGALADWLDFHLIYEVAKARPNYSFVLVGGFDREKSVTMEGVSKLRELSNIWLTGHRPVSEIPCYLGGFDVCVIPFVRNRVTQATDPVKLYEYLAAGKPVVTTTLPEIRHCGAASMVHFADEPEDFARCLDAALEERDANLVEARKGFAASNTWTARYEAFDRAIRARLTSR
jgi:glycosyltransferase involved in cell wall biosynthesis